MSPPDSPPDSPKTERVEFILQPVVEHSAQPNHSLESFCPLERTDSQETLRPSKPPQPQLLSLTQQSESDPKLPAICSCSKCEARELWATDPSHTIQLSSQCPPFPSNQRSKTFEPDNHWECIYCCVVNYPENLTCGVCYMKSLERIRRGIERYIEAERLERVERFPRCTLRREKENGGPRAWGVMSGDHVPIPKPKNIKAKGNRSPGLNDPDGTCDRSYPTHPLTKPRILSHRLLIPLLHTFNLQPIYPGSTPWTLRLCAVSPIFFYQACRNPNYDTPPILFVVSGILKSVEGSNASNNCVGQRVVYAMLHFPPAPWHHTTACAYQHIGYLGAIFRLEPHPILSRADPRRGTVSSCTMRFNPSNPLDNLDDRNTSFYSNINNVRGLDDCFVELGLEKGLKSGVFGGIGQRERFEVTGIEFWRFELECTGGARSQIVEAY